MKILKKGTRYGKVLIILLALFSLILNDKVNATTLSSFSISLLDSQVSHTTQISFAMILSGTTKFANGIVYFNVPSPGSFTPASSACSCSSGSVTITQCTFTGSNSVTMVFTTTSSTQSSLIFRVTNFNNPPSTFPITGLTGTYSDISNNPIQTSTTGILSTLLPNPILTTPIYISNNQIIGSVDSVLTVQFIPDYSIPSNGKISLIFPLWSTESMIQSASPICIGVSPMNIALSCQFNSGTQTLIITNIASSQLLSGIQYSFSVGSFRNPYSGVPKSGFTLSTLDSQGGKFQQTTQGTIQVTQFASFTTASINERGDSITTIGELSIIQPSFEIDLPLDINCRLRITFPSDMPLNTDLTLISGTSPFIFSTFVSVYSNTVGNQYIEIDGCQTAFTSSVNFGFLTLSSLKNKGYVQSTGSFKFQLYAVVGSILYNIAEQTTGITINDFTTGNIQLFSITSNNYNVQESTIFTCTITPTHNIPTSSQITIQFPNTIILNSGLCTIGSVSGAISTSPNSCSISQNTLTIINPFATSSYSSSSGTFRFSFVTSSGNSGQNPISALVSTGTFIVNTYTINGGSYLIDSSTFSDIYIPVATILSQVVVTAPLNYCSGSTYSLIITPNKQIPIGGQIKVVFPTEITMASGVLSTCQVIISSVTNNSPTCTVTSINPVTIIISGSNVFSIAYTTLGTPFSVTMSGLTNPSTQAVTQSFSVYTMDSFNNVIEYKSSGITVQMASSFDSLSSVQAQLSSNINGAIGNIIMTIVTNCPLLTNSILSLTIPSQIYVPVTVICSTVLNLSGVICSNTGNAITVILKVISTLASGSTVQFSINSITNPITNCITNQFSNIFFAQPSQSANVYTGIYPQLQTSVIPEAVGQLIQTSNAFDQSTNYTILYFGSFQIPAGSTYKIGYPSEITVPSTLTSCYSTINQIVYYMTCTVNTSLNEISMTRTLESLPIVLTSAKLKLTFGPITNPSTSQTHIPSFTLISYLDQSQLCSIQQITTNLLVTFPTCSSPCAQCGPTVITCTSCITNYYLYQNTCVKPCPVSTGALTTATPQTCVVCDTNCQTCNGETPSTCLSCATGKVLYNGQCIASCPDNTFQPVGSQICNACDTNCQTCSGLSTNCITCNTGSLYPLFYKGKCVATCPSDTIAQSGSCVACLNSCKTCTSTTSQCTSCNNGKFLYQNTCYTTCPTKTIGITNNAIPYCTDCGTNCTQCLKSSPLLTCTQCISGSVLYNGACILACPTKMYADTNNICQNCHATCQTCTGPTSKNCFSCDPLSKYPLFYKQQCVSYCASDSIRFQNICVPCLTTCKTCTVTADHCTTCQSGMQLDGSVCIDSPPCGWNILCIFFG